MTTKHKLKKKKDRKQTLKNIKKAGGRSRWLNEAYSEQGRYNKLKAEKLEEMKKEDKQASDFSALANKKPEQKESK